VSHRRDQAFTRRDRYFCNGATFAARVLKPDDLRQQHLRLLVSHNKADRACRVGLLKQAAYTVLLYGVEQPATEYEELSRYCD
jgi:hypothetical protein